MREIIKASQGIRKEITLIERRLQDLKDQAYKISPVYSPVPKGGNNGSRIEEAVTRIVDMENQLINDRLDLLQKEAQISIMVNLIDDRTRRCILADAGLLGKKDYELADEYGYSERHIRRLLKRCYMEIASKMSYNVL